MYKNLYNSLFEIHKFTLGYIHYIVLWVYLPIFDFCSIMAFEFNGGLFFFFKGKGKLNSEGTVVHGSKVSVTIAWHNEYGPLAAQKSLL